MNKYIASQDCWMTWHIIDKEIEREVQDRTQNPTHVLTYIQKCVIYDKIWSDLENKTIYFESMQVISYCKFVFKILAKSMKFKRFLRKEILKERLHWSSCFFPGFFFVQNFAWFHCDMELLFFVRQQCIVLSLTIQDLFGSVQLIVSC